MTAAAIQAAAAPAVAARRELDSLVLLTSDFRALGGAEKNMLELLAGALDRGIRPYLVALKAGPLLERARQMGVETLDLRLHQIATVEAWRTARRLRNWIQERGIRVMVTYHHDADLWGGLVGQSAGVVTVSSRRDLGFQLTGAHRLAYRLMNRRYDGILTVADAVKAKIVHEQGAPVDKIVTIRNGIEPAPARSGAGDRIRREIGAAPGLLVGTIASFRPIKGQLYLARAAVEVIRRFPKVRFAIAGEANTPYGDEVRTEIRRLGIEPNFALLGDRKDVPDLLAAFDLFVLPSLEEGFSNALVEAMAAGCPVVATRVGGNPEAVTDGDTGVLVPPAQPEALARGIIRLLDDAGESRRMGLRGRERALTVFSRENMIDQTFNWLESLVRARKRGVHL